MSTDPQSTPAVTHLIYEVERPTAGQLRIRVLDTTIVNVVPPSIQGHLGDSRTRVAAGCAGSMP